MRNNLKKPKPPPKWNLPVACDWATNSFPLQFERKRKTEGKKAPKRARKCVFELGIQQGVREADVFYGVAESQILRAKRIQSQHCRCGNKWKATRHEQAIYWRPGVRLNSIPANPLPQNVLKSFPSLPTTELLSGGGGAQHGSSKTATQKTTKNAKKINKQKAQKEKPRK